MSPLAKRLLYASFVLSFLLALLALHVHLATGPSAPPRGEVYTEPVLLRLGIPRAVASGLILVCATGYLVSVIGAVALLRRRATVRVLLPVGSLILCQALWFAIPTLLDVTRTWSARTLAFAAIWISAAHSMQYLWVTFHYAKRSAGGARLGGFLLKTTLAGNAAIVIPGILFAPMLLGTSLTWEEGLSTLVFAVINLHHFMLDGAVWKLRDGRVARALLRDGRGEPATPPAIGSPHSRRLVSAVWALCAVCLAIEFAELARHHAQERGAQGVANAMFGALHWAGRDHPIEHVRFGRALLERGDYAAARVAFEQSLQTHPTVGAWGGIGRALEGESDLAGAADAYEAGLTVDPNDTPLLRSAAAAHARLGDYERAVELLTRALALEPRNPTNRRMLNRVRHKLEGADTSVAP